MKKNKVFNRRDFMKNTLAASAVSGYSLNNLISHNADISENNKKPNLLLIVIDGFRSEMIGCSGNSLVQTPNIDALAKKSVRFENAFSAHSVCMPARASIFTGRYPSVNGVWANGVPLSKNEITIAHVLKDNGYATGSSGKHHFEPQAAPGYPPDLKSLPDYYGFKEVHLSENLKGSEYTEFVQKNYPEFVRTVKRKGSENVGRTADLLVNRSVPEEANQLNWIVNQTINFIKDKAKKDEPFFAFTSFHELIPPSFPPADFQKMYDPAEMPMPKRREGELDNKPPHYKKVHEMQVKSGWQPDDEKYKTIMAGYYAEMSFIDKQLGRIIKTLENLNLMDNTVIAIMGDHGLCLNDHWIWRHGPWLYEQVIKVPLIIYDPALHGGKVIEELVESVDLMPTLLESLDVPPPAGVQGKSFRPLLMNKSGAQGKETIWVDDRDSPELLDAHTNAFGLESFRVMALRNKDWKLIHYPGSPWGELYNLNNDPGEFENLWAEPQYRNIKNEMQAQLLDRVIEGNDPLPVRQYPW